MDVAPPKQLPPTGHVIVLTRTVTPGTHARTSGQNVNFPHKIDYKTCSAHTGTNLFRISTHKVKVTVVGNREW